MLFSATMPKALVEFTRTGMMHDSMVIRLDSEVQVSDELRIGFITCRSATKDAVLLLLVRDVLPLMKGTDTTGTNDTDGGRDYAEEEEENIEDDNEDEDEQSKKKRLKKARKNAAKEEQKKKRVGKGKDSKRGLTFIFAATQHNVEYPALLLTTSGLSTTHNTATWTMVLVRKISMPSRVDDVPYYL
jgi:ATP-dependent RNA helicase DDX54/DBP10